MTASGRFLRRLDAMIGIQTQDGDVGVPLRRGAHQGQIFVVPLWATDGSPYEAPRGVEAFWWKEDMGMFRRLQRVPERICGGYYLVTMTAEEIGVGYTAVRVCALGATDQYFVVEALEHAVVAGEGRDA